MPITEVDLPYPIRVALARPILTNHDLPILTGDARKPVDDHSSRKFKLADQAENLINNSGEVITHGLQIPAFPYSRYLRRGGLYSPMPEYVTQYFLRRSVPVLLGDRELNLQVIRNLRTIPDGFTDGRMHSLVALECASQYLAVRELFLIPSLGPNPCVNWDSQPATLEDMEAASQTLSLLEKAQS